MGSLVELRAARYLLDRRQRRAWLPLVLMYVRDRGGLDVLLIARYLGLGT